METLNKIISIEILSNDGLDYDIKVCLEYPNNKERTSKITGFFESHPNKEKFIAKIKGWTTHFLGWKMEPDDALEGLDITKLEGIDANITDWPHFRTSNGKLISVFKLVHYVINEMP